ncbi:hypothetical protein QRX50_34260 [Amycolatopsis carbonis]|uniref:Uncharacterized protein n=1 Tax=Amycolatopsis carbonis TaxID=715471 RepID=A0A9Y2IBI7_9PSEU|nr:hypothetical protein [Amycolatopsis sp. 2-15]WIX76504.1 hypothetical protein QRX50_34260 [Amycolatopsis sp. 2-15]
MALDELDSVTPSGVVLLNTDADTEVTPVWALRHLDRARRGWHASAGPAHLSATFPGSSAAAARYHGIVAGAEANVYGANLAVRADAHLAVGGFGPLATGEDHALWHRLGSAGFRRCHEPAARVFTSPRLHGRAPGGLASLLHGLTHPDSAGVTSAGASRSTATPSRRPGCGEPAARGRTPASAGDAAPRGGR